MNGLVGLYKRNRTWGFRVRVPSDIQSIIGKKEVRKSLKTRDYRLAVIRYRRICSEIEIQFENARHKIYLSEKRATKVVHTTGPQVSENLDFEILESGPDVSPANQNIDLKKLIKLVASEVLSSLNETKPKRKYITIGELYDRYMSDPASVRSAKSIIEYNAAFSVLRELIGENTTLDKIDRATCRRVMDKLRFLPPRAKKLYPKKSYVEISDIARKRGLTPISPGTVNKRLAHLSAMFNWGMREELIDKNPAIGLSVADTVRAKDKRLPFSPEQLQKIFSDRLFTEKDYGDKPSRYWVPLIGLMSGMRLNEICQLNVEDLQEFDGVPCFNVTETVINGPKDKVIKTLSSERVVPIHPELIKLGLLDYQKSLPTNGKLFPDIQMAVNGYRSDTFTKHFQRFLIKTGAKQPKTSFHSFRHNFRDALRNAQVRHEVVLALGGWVGDSGVESNYGRGYSAKVLLEEIAKIHSRFP